VSPFSKNLRALPQTFRASGLASPRNVDFVLTPLTTLQLADLLSMSISAAAVHFSDESIVVAYSQL